MFYFLASLLAFLGDGGLFKEGRGWDSLGSHRQCGTSTMDDLPSFLHPSSPRLLGLVHGDLMGAEETLSLDTMTLT